MSRVNVGTVGRAVVEMIRAAVPAEILVGYGAMPSLPDQGDRLIGPDTVTDRARGYGIVWPITAGEGGLIGGGWLGQAGAITVVRFQLDGCGVQLDQAQWVAELMVGIVVDRAATPGAPYVHTLTIPEHSVVNREQGYTVPQDSSGGVVKVGHIVDVTVHATG